jgi:hypothetical protein
LAEPVYGALRFRVAFGNGWPAGELPFEVTIPSEEGPDVVIHCPPGGLTPWVSLEHLWLALSALEGEMHFDDCGLGECNCAELKPEVYESIRVLREALAVAGPRPARVGGIQVD